MKRRELERAIRAASQVAEESEFLDPKVATLPSGWQRLLKPFHIGKIKVLCLDLPDLVVSKLAAGRLKDLEFVGALERLGL